MFFLLVFVVELAAVPHLMYCIPFKVVQLYLIYYGDSPVYTRRRVEY